MRPQSTCRSRSPAASPGLDAVAQRQKAVVVQPCIQMNAAPETVESMVGERDEQGLVVAELEGLADDGVAAAVTVVDDPGEFGTGGHAAIGRVVGLGEPPEHVLNSVRRVEQAVEKPFLERIPARASIIASRSRQAISHWSRYACSEIRSLFSPAWSSTMPVV